MIPEIMADVRENQTTSVEEKLRVRVVLLERAERIAATRQSTKPVLLSFQRGEWIADFPCSAKNRERSHAAEISELSAP